MISEKEIKKYQKFLEDESQDPNDLIKNSGLDPSQDFKGFNFEGMYLPNVNFEDFNLENATFKNSILRGANFKRANLINSTFDHTNLYRSDFRNAALKNVKLSKVALFNTLGLDTHLQKHQGFDSIIDPVLFIEDEKKDIIENVKLVKETFPGVQLKIAKNENQARQLLKGKAFSAVIIDAKIPKFEEEGNEQLNGITISEDLTNGNLIPINSEMRHIVYTTHVPERIDESYADFHNYLGILPKTKLIAAFEKKVIPNLFDQFLQNLKTSS